MIFSNLSPHHEHGSGLAFSPLLSQFVTPCNNPDKDGLITAALLTLLGAPPLLVASVYAPAGEIWRRKVETSLRPLLKQFPSFLLGGDEEVGGMQPPSFPFFLFFFFWHGGFPPKV